jgi:hypothetical protein
MHTHYKCPYQTFVIINLLRILQGWLQIQHSLQIMSRWFNKPSIKIETAVESELAGLQLRPHYVFYYFERI